MVVWVCGSGVGDCGLKAEVCSIVLDPGIPGVRAYCVFNYICNFAVAFWHGLSEMGFRGSCLSVRTFVFPTLRVVSPLSELSAKYSNSTFSSQFRI